MNLRNTLASAAIVALALPQAVHAAPATVMLYPSTDIYDRGRFHLDSDLVSHNARQTTFASAGLNVGLGPGRDGVFGRTDIGIEYLPAPLNGVSAGRRVIYNIKTQLYNQTKGPMTMRLVMGVRGLGWGGGQATGNTVGPKNIGYIVGSRTFGKFGRVHLGIAHSYADKAFLTTPGGHSDRTYLQAGYDRALGSRFRFATDFYSGKSTVSALAPSIIYYVDDKANFQIGYIRYNDSSIAPRTQVYGGFNYDFGGAPPYRVEGERQPEDGSAAVTSAAPAKADSAARVTDVLNQTSKLSPDERRELANQILNDLQKQK